MNPVHPTPGISLPPIPGIIPTSHGPALTAVQGIRILNTCLNTLILVHRGCGAYNAGIRDDNPLIISVAVPVQPADEMDVDPPAPAIATPVIAAPDQQGSNH